MMMMIVMMDDDDEYDNDNDDSDDDDDDNDDDESVVVTLSLSIFKSCIQSTRPQCNHGDHHKRAWAEWYFHHQDTERWHFED